MTIHISPEMFHETRRLKSNLRFSIPSLQLDYTHFHKIKSVFLASEQCSYLHFHGFFSPSLSSFFFSFSFFFFYQNIRRELFQIMSNTPYRTVRDYLYALEIIFHSTNFKHLNDNK